MTLKPIPVVLALASILLARPASADDAPAVTISRPAAQPDGCFAEHARVPRSAVEHLPAAATLRFTVDDAGRISAVRLQGAGDRSLAAHLRSALERCEWVPGADAHGVPMTVAVLMPIRFVD
jgi:hypothetical protein